LKEAEAEARRTLTDVCGRVARSYGEAVDGDARRRSVSNFLVGGGWALRLLRCVCWCWTSYHRMVIERRILDYFPLQFFPLRQRISLYVKRKVLDLLTPRNVEEVVLYLKEISL
jgi:hypothetical protein